MVSIFAETVYSETINFDFADATGNGRLNDVPLSNFPTVDISSSIPGFAYIETLVMEASVTGNMEVNNQRPNNRSDPVLIESTPSFIFNNQVDIFSAVGPQTVTWFTGVGSDNFVGPFSATEAVPVDTYVDTPAEIGVNNPELGSGVHAAVTPSSGTITMDLTLIGRIP